MLYASTKTLLRSIVQSLETTDSSEWDGQIEAANQALYEIYQMSKPQRRAYQKERSDAKWPSQVPDSTRLSMAVPHVKSMLVAIRRRDQATAIESGRAALAAM